MKDDPQLHNQWFVTAGALLGAFVAPFPIVMAAILGVAAVQAGIIGLVVSGLAAFGFGISCLWTVVRSWPSLLRSIVVTNYVIAMGVALFAYTKSILSSLPW